MPMTKTADLVIVGGGIVGVSIAYHLASKGMKNLLLLEKNQIGEGSTGFCVGGIRRQWSTDVNMQFALKAYDVFQNFAEEFGVDPGFHQSGYLFLATSDEKLEAFRANVDFQNRYAVTSQILTREEVQKGWPFLNTSDILGAAYCETDGYAAPHEVTHAIAGAAKRLGVEICQEAEVTSIEVKRGCITSVTSSQGRVATPVVVNAAGPHAALLGKMAGVDVPVKPIRRQIFFTDAFDQIPSSVPLTIDPNQNFYFRREGKSVLLSGPQDETPSYNLTTDFDSELETAEKAAYRIPVLEQARITRGWAGLYEISPDHHSILGQAPEVEGLFLAAGFSGHGFQHGPVAGQVMAELIVDGRAETIDISPLAPTRFQEGKAIKETLTAFRD